MKDTEFAYAVARIRANEYRLLSSGIIESLIDASDYKEALKILSESGYGNINSDNEDQVLNKVQRQAFDLVYESAPDKSCLDFLIIRNDFHNLKAILKCIYSEASPDSLLLTPSVVNPSVIKTAFETKDYSLLPEFLSDTAKRAYELLMLTGDGQSLEVYLDKKGIEASVYLAKRTKDEFSVGLSLVMASLANIKIALRCLRTGKSADFVSEALADIESFDKKALCEAVSFGEEELCRFVRSLGYENLSESIKKGYAAFEKVSDDIIIERVKSAKYKSLGVSPLAAYYFAADAEVKTVRIILSCKKNGLSGENIRERVRELYV